MTRAELLAWARDERPFDGSSWSGAPNVSLAEVKRAVVAAITPTEIERRALHRTHSRLTELLLRHDRRDATRPDAEYWNNDLDAMDGTVAYIARVLAVPP